MDDPKKDQIVIEADEVEVAEPKAEDFDVEGLMPTEIELAKKHGLYKEQKEEDVEHNEQPEVKTEDLEKEPEEKINKDPDNFEEMDKVFEKDEKKFRQEFTPNQKALYFKHKSERRKRQDYEKRLIDAEKQLEMLKDSSVSSKKLDKIAKMLNENTENLTIEELQNIITEKEEVIVDKKEEAKDVNQVVSERIAYADKIGITQYDNFKELTELAGEIFNQKPRYQKQFRDMILDNTVDETEIVDFIVDIARLHKNYNVEKVDPKVKEEADRVLKNSKKKVSSAIVGGGSGNRRIISESELTCDQVAQKAKNMSTEDYKKFWSSLKETTRKRILQGIDP